MMLWHFETQLECNNNDVVHARHPSQLHIIDEDLSLCSSGLRLPYKNYEFHLQEFLNARKVSRKHKNRKKITMKESEQLKHARVVLESILVAILAADQDAVAVTNFLAMTLGMITFDASRGLWIKALYGKFPTLKDVGVDWKVFEDAVLGLQTEELAMLLAMLCNNGKNKTPLGTPPPATEQQNITEAAPTTTPSKAEAASATTPTEFVAAEGEREPVSDLTSRVSTTAFARDMVDGPAPDLPSIRSEGTYTFNLDMATLGLVAKLPQEEVVDFLHNEPSEETTPATTVHSPPATRNVNAPLSDLSIAMMSEEPAPPSPPTSVQSAPAPRPVNPLSSSDLSIAMKSNVDYNGSM